MPPTSFVAPSHVAEAVRVSHGRLRSGAASLEVVPMITSSLPRPDALQHAVFLAILPKLQMHAQIQFALLRAENSVRTRFWKS